MRIGFDNDKYLKIQSEHIKERISQFGWNIIRSILSFPNRKSRSAMINSKSTILRSQSSLKSLYKP